MENEENKLKEAIADFFYGKSYPEMKKEKIPYCRKLGENSWEIFSGETTILCNDAGKALFDKALMEAAKKIYNGK